MQVKVGIAAVGNLAMELAHNIHDNDDDVASKLQLEPLWIEPELEPSSLSLSLSVEYTYTVYTH